jgi:hypothetical protein
MSAYSVIRADLLTPGARGFAVVDETGLRIVPFVLGHVLSYGEAALIAREKTDAAKPTRKPRKRRKQSHQCAGHACPDGSDFDNLGESPDY